MSNLPGPCPRCGDSKPRYDQAVAGDHCSASLTCETCGYMGPSVSGRSVYRIRITVVNAWNTAGKGIKP
jgi:hypothetical protein